MSRDKGLPPFLLLMSLFRRLYTTDTKVIDAIVKRYKLVLFMKGTPTKPMCGFSRTVVDVLQREGVPEYQAVNVLQDENVRSAIKEYTYVHAWLSTLNFFLDRRSWPTIPQMFIKGEFVGGCDSVLEMHKNGELRQKLQAADIIPVDKS